MRLEGERCIVYVTGICETLEVDVMEVVWADTVQWVGWRLSFARLKALVLWLLPLRHICMLMDLSNASEGWPDGIPDTGVFEVALCCAGYVQYESGQSTVHR